MNVVDLSKNRVNDGFFLLNKKKASTFEWPPPDSNPYRFLGTYRDSGTPLRDALIEIIRGARKHVFLASFLIGDEAVVNELVSVAERLRGGVYIITALDEKSLRRGIAEYEDEDEDQDQDQADPEERGKNFHRLTEKGVYVRGHESCHAKFSVVDKSVALVGSANFIKKGFEWTGEADAVIRDPYQVKQLERLFTQLWYEGCLWEVPPGLTYVVADRQPAQTPYLPDRPNSCEPGAIWTNGATETYLLESMTDVINRARCQLTLASYSISGMNEKQHLLIEPLQAALDRGVSVRLFVRQRNPNASQRADLCRLFDMGVEIYGDLRNHAKGIVADGTMGCLFSSNFDAAHGLESGVEVGVRLDGQTALKDFENYLDHAIRSADAYFLRNPTLEQLDGQLAARWCKPWPGEKEMRVACSLAVAQRFVAEASEGPVLYETADGVTRLFAGDAVLALRQRGETTEGAIEIASEGMTVVRRLESWLASVRGKDNRTPFAMRGFCPARITFSNV